MWRQSRWRRHLRLAAIPLYIVQIKTRNVVAVNKETVLPVKCC